MSCDSLGYDRVALEANADGAAINFQLHQQIKSSDSLPLTNAVAASAADAWSAMGSGVRVSFALFFNKVSPAMASKRFRRAAFSMPKL